MTPATVAARAVVVDIEGTTSTISFVRDVLFPYAHEHLDAYVTAHRKEPVVAQAMVDAAREAGEEPDVDDATVLAHLHRWIDEDRKVTPLKTLQGLIWAEGYAKTGLRGHVYPDAAAGLRRWRATGIRLYVYSSGSIDAQKVLFKNSNGGDLSWLLSGYFDTTIGPKRAVASYRAIAKSIGLPSREIVFLSDVDAELDAAREAGFQTLRLLRAADTPPGATTTHASATSFDEIDVTPPERYAAQ
jgi:enolase-phosphatase E1